MSHDQMDHNSMNHDHHMDHSSMNHDHMDNAAMNISNAINSTVVANLTNLLFEGVKQASDHLSHLTPENDMNHMHGDHNSMNMEGGSTMRMTGAGHTDMHMDGDMMKMYFHFGYSEYILFHGWHISTVGGLIGSMIGIFCLALLYEGLKYVREVLFKKSISSLQMYAQTENKIVTPRNVPLQYSDQILIPTTLNMLSYGHLIQTLLHMVQFVLAYCLMLIFMTYNVWLGMACTFGAGFGYFLFGWKKSVVMDVVEHCH